MKRTKELEEVNQEIADIKKVIRVGSRKLNDRLTGVQRTLDARAPSEK